MAKVFLDIDIGDADAHASEVAGCACAACRPVALRGVPRACDSRTVVPAQRGSVRASSWPAAAPTTACRVRMSAHPLPSSARVPLSPACVSLSLSAHSFCLSLALFSAPTHGHAPHARAHAGATPSDLDDAGKELLQEVYGSDPAAAEGPLRVEPPASLRSCASPTFSACVRTRTYTQDNAHTHTHLRTRAHAPVHG